MNTYISREQDYALRIASTLASLGKEEKMSVTNLSKKLFISKNFAARIAHKLIKENIFGSVQGKYGGIFLKRDAAKLSVFEILDVIGFKVKFNLCLSSNFECELIKFCKYYSFFAKQEEIILENLKQKKLSEFVY